MNEDGVIILDNILTVLIGVAIVAFIYLILYRKKVSKRRRIENKAAFPRKDQATKNIQEPTSNKSSHS